jgi:Flp pilus assembly protein CpaB
VRRAAINASTVFAVILAILAGLIFAWVFKVAFLDRKPQPKPAEEKRIPLTVAAVNIPDKTRVTPGMIKTIRLTQEEYDQRLAAARVDRRTVLVGNQPVDRTTVTVIKAEEPMFEGQFEEFTYPVPVSKLLAPGKQSVMVEVPANTTMVQKGDLVDVMCSLSNERPVFGPAGSSATATLAKAVRVIARFHTTATAARPPAGNSWPYTLEVEPWQAAAIELARQIGGQFSLTVASGDVGSTGDSLGATPASASNTVAEQAYKNAAARYAETGRFTVSDLAALFGVEEPEPERFFRLEMMAGNRPAGVRDYPLPPAPKETKDEKSPAKNGTMPAPAPSNTTKPRASSGNASRSVASNTGNKGAGFGFHPVGWDPNACPTCGKKQ